MKRVLLVNKYFWPDVAATGQLLADLAEDLSERGWDMRVLTGRSRYASTDGVSSLPRRERWRQVEIFRVWCTSFGRSSTIGRLTDYATFLISAALTALTMRRHDVTVCLSTPPFIAVLGLLAQWRGSRFIYKVEDLYPDVAIALDSLKAGSSSQRWLDKLSRFLLSRADRVIALDQAMARTLEERGARRVSVIPNWADGEAIRPDPKEGETVRSSLDWEDSFVVLYSGNMGLAHRFDTVIEAARMLADEHSQILFAFVGGGLRRQEIEAARAKLPNLRLYEYQPRERLNGLYNAADVHLVVLRDEVAGLLVPSKYAAALAAGKPVLLVGGRGSDLHGEIQRLGIGWVCAHDASEIEAALTDAMADPASVRQMGLRARKRFEAEYSRTEASARWARVITEVVARSSEGAVNRA